MQSESNDVIILRSSLPASFIPSATPHLPSRTVTDHYSETQLSLPQADLLAQVKERIDKTCIASNPKLHWVSPITVTHNHSTYGKIAFLPFFLQGRHAVRRLEMGQLNFA